MFAYEFIWIAVITGLFLAIGSSFLSPFLVLSNKSLIADGLSHASFTGIIIGLLLFDEPIWVALIFTVIASLLITFVSKRLKTNSDTAIGVIGAVSMAVGLIIISLNTGFNQTIESLLVGNIFSISYLIMILVIVIAVIICCYVLLTYRKLVAALYDPEFARHKKIKVDLHDYILSILVGLLVVVGVRAVGILLMSSLVIFPSLIAKNLANNFRQNLFLGIIISVIVLFSGIVIAHYLAIPAASTIVSLYGIILIVIYLIARIKKHAFN